MSRKVIRKFEHEYLRIGEGEEEITKAQFEALCRYFDTNSKFYSLGRNKIKFNHHVGVIQVGDLTLEVLPKAVKDDSDKDKWHNKLIEILKYTKKIRSYKSSTASLDLYNTNLMDLYLSVYLEEVSEILRTGLRKKYRNELRNLNCVKGQIHFPSNISKNLYNKAKVSCNTLTYDHNHIIHSALKKALEIINVISSNQSIKSRSKALLLDFPDSIESKVCIDNLNRVQLDRHTKRYENALNLAKLIIKSFNPTSSSGQCSVLAFMFDMNHLYEEYIFKIVKSVAVGMGGDAVRRKKIFWESKVIKPDIYIEVKDKAIILDTKWKILVDDLPSDNDLKQMYVYNSMFEINNSFLAYPVVDKVKLSGNGEFLDSRETKSRCEVVELSIENDKKEVIHSLLKRVL